MNASLEFSSNLQPPVGLERGITPRLLDFDPGSPSWPAMEEDRIAVAPALAAPLVFSATTILVVGAAAWAACVLARDPRGAAQALQTTGRELQEVFHWSAGQVQQAVRYLTEELPRLFSQANFNAFALKDLVRQLPEELAQHVGTYRIPAQPGALPFQRQGRNRHVGSPSPSRAETAAQQAARTPAQAAQRRLMRLSRDLDGLANEAKRLVALAERILHSGVALTGQQIQAVRAAEIRVAGLTLRIDAAFAQLVKVGWYSDRDAQPRHPVSAMLSAWMRSLDAKLRSAGQVGTPTQSKIHPAGATHPSEARSLSSTRTDLGAALSAVGPWGRALRTVCRLPAEASAARRQQALDTLQQTEATMRQQLARPAVLALLLRGTAAATGGPPLRPEDDKNLTLLLSGLANALGSVVGDSLQGFVTGKPVGQAEMQRGGLIAFAVGMIFPGGAGVLRRMQENAAACVAEGAARQMSGLDPQDPRALAVNALFCAGAGAVADGIFRALERVKIPRMAIEGIGEPLRSTARPRSGNRQKSTPPTDNQAATGKQGPDVTPSARVQPLSQMRTQRPNGVALSNEDPEGWSRIWSAWAERHPDLAPEMHQYLKEASLTTATYSEYLARTGEAEPGWLSLAEFVASGGVFPRPVVSPRPKGAVDLSISGQKVTVHSLISSHQGWARAIKDHRLDSDLRTLEQGGWNIVIDRTLPANAGFAIPTSKVLLLPSDVGELGRNIEKNGSFEFRVG